MLTSAAELSVAGFHPLAGKSVTEVYLWSLEHLDAHAAVSIPLRGKVLRKAFMQSAIDDTIVSIPLRGKVLRKPEWGVFKKACNGFHPLAGKSVTEEFV